MGERKLEGSKQGDKNVRVRCAIYTRKSTEEGLNQDFNSLHAQRDAAEAFIASQKDLGWVALPNHYDDGGFGAAIWIGRRSSNCLPTSRRAAWTAWWSTRWTGSAGPCSTSLG